MFDKFLIVIVGYFAGTNIGSHKERFYRWCISGIQ